MLLPDTLPLVALNCITGMSTVYVYFGTVVRSVSNSGFNPVNVFFEAHEYFIWNKDTVTVSERGGMLTNLFIC